MYEMRALYIQFFIFKQKTAYEMRISDWSSDVCSSDLPLTTTMLSVPGANTVRGYSFFGDSYVYVLFEDGTDLYWARSRVLEYLSQVQSRLPAAAKPDRKSVVQGKSVSVRVYYVGRLPLQNKKANTVTY